MNPPCGYPLCPAIAVDGHEHCPIHSPAKVVERAKAIVTRHIAAAKTVDDGNGLPTTHDLLTKILADILRDLDRTV